MRCPLTTFRAVWLIDFEFSQPDGELPEVRCMVAREWRTGRTLRLWADQLHESPINFGPDVLAVAYYSSAEWNCFLQLDWPLPERILDLYAEFKCHTSGLPVPCGYGLLGALAYCGIDGIDVAEKQEMRELAIRGGHYTAAERKSLLDYCESDTVALGKLLTAMAPWLDLPRALLRGRYMLAAARMERTGIPVDVDVLGQLREHWDTIKVHLVREVDRTYGCYTPAGVVVDPDTRLGAAVLAAADEHGINPYRLRAAVDEVWAVDGQSDRDQRAAVAAARKATGLTATKAAEWERDGKDYSSWPHLDVQARTLAGEYPALGIGKGYESGTGEDSTDYAGRLWAILREPNRAPTFKWDRPILAAAVSLCRSAGDEWTPAGLSFSAERFAAWLIKNNIPWPRLESGALALDDDTFRQMAKAYPAVSPLRELRHALSELRLESLAVGHDGRNRCMLSAFASRTGRNQPSNSRFLFGPSVWIRGLIKPEPGRAVAYIDFEQQEFAIGAALSGDSAMQAAYLSGDPYLAFAKQAGAAPPDATKHSHADVRGQFKVCALAVQYGMQEHSLALALGTSPAHARELLGLHKQTYPAFWRWSQAAVDHAMLRGYLQTVFGWRVHVGANANPRSLANFPCQGNGAEMLRLACCMLTEAGIETCAPVHDAVLIEADEDKIDETVALAQQLMGAASEVVLSGFRVRTEAEIVRYPDRYMDEKRGGEMWRTVTGILEASCFNPAHVDCRFETPL